MAINFGHLYIFTFQTYDLHFLYFSSKSGQVSYIKINLTLMSTSSVYYNMGIPTKTKLKPKLV